MTAINLHVFYNNTSLKNDKNRCCKTCKRITWQIFARVYVPHKTPKNYCSKACWEKRVIKKKDDFEDVQ